MWQRFLCGLLAFVLMWTSVPSTSLVAASPTAVTASSFTDPQSLTIPSSLGWIVERWVPPGEPSPTWVIHIQDLHAHEPAQAKLSQLIEYLHKTLGVDLVAVEGAQGRIDTTTFSAFPDQYLNAKLAALFLKHGLFTGPEQYAVTHPGAVTLWGVDDEALYRQHLQVYRRNALDEVSLTRDLATLTKALESLKRQLYSRDLTRFDTQRRAFHQGRLTWPAYLEFLSDEAQVHHLRLNDAPNLDHTNLTHLERAVDQQFRTTPAQRQLGEVASAIELIDDLLHATLTRETLDELLQRRSTLTPAAFERCFLTSRARLPHGVSSDDLSRSLRVICHALDAHLRFYELALERDNALVSNTLNLLTLHMSHSEIHAPNATILITGGFHTPGMTAQLRAHHIAYLVITPRIDDPVDGTAYRELLRAHFPTVDTLWREARAMLQTPVYLSENLSAIASLWAALQERLERLHARVVSHPFLFTLSHQAMQFAIWWAEPVLLMVWGTHQDLSLVGVKVAMSLPAFPVEHVHGHGRVKMWKGLLNHLILDAVALDPARIDARTVQKLEEQLARFRGQRFWVVTGASGFLAVTPLQKCPLLFTHLAPRTAYLIQPFWEPGIGLQIYLLSGHEVIGYGVEKYKGMTPQTRRKPVPASLKIRAQDLAAARHELVWSEAFLALIRRSLAIDPLAPDPLMLTELESLLVAFRAQQVEMSIPSDVEGWTVTPVRNEALYFSSLFPGRYAIQPYWEEGVGLCVYFVDRQGTVGYGLGPYYKAYPRRKRHTTVAPLLVRAQTIALARATNKARLESLIIHARRLMESQRQGPILEQIERHITIFNAHEFLATPPPSAPVGAYSLNPLRRENLRFHQLRPETYRVFAEWNEIMQRFVLYFVHPGEVVGYDVESYLVPHAGRYGTSARRQVRAQTLKEAQTLMTDPEYRRREGIRAIVLPCAVDPQSHVVTSLPDTRDFYSDVVSRDLHDKVFRLLVAHGYTPPQIEKFLDVADSMTSGLELEEAFMATEVPASEYAWFRQQWVEVLPQVLRTLHTGVPTGSPAAVFARLADAGSATIQDLAGRLGRKPSTIARDLSALEARGLVQRPFGGGARAQTTVYDLTEPSRRMAPHIKELLYRALPVPQPTSGQWHHVESQLRELLTRGRPAQLSSAHEPLENGTAPPLSAPVMLFGSGHDHIDDGRWAAQQLLEQVRSLRDAEGRPTRPIVLWLEHATAPGLLRTVDKLQHALGSSVNLVEELLKDDLDPALKARLQRRYDLVKPQITEDVEEQALKDTAHVKPLQAELYEAVEQLRREGWQIIVKFEISTVEAYLDGLRMELSVERTQRFLAEGKILEAEQAVEATLRHLVQEIRHRELTYAGLIAERQGMDPSAVHLVFRGSAHVRTLAELLHARHRLQAAPTVRPVFSQNSSFMSRLFLRYAEARMPAMETPVGQRYKKELLLAYILEEIKLDVGFDAPLREPLSRWLGTVDEAVLDRWMAEVLTHVSDPAERVQKTWLWLLDHVGDYTGIAEESFNLFMQQLLPQLQHRDQPYGVSVNLAAEPGRRFMADDLAHPKAVALATHLNAAFSLLETVTQPDGELHAYVEHLLTAEDNRSFPIHMQVGFDVEALNVSEVRLFNQQQGVVRIKLSQRFIDALLRAPPEHDEAVTWILAERLFHALGHTNAHHQAAEALQEEKTLIEWDFKLFQKASPRFQTEIERFLNDPSVKETLSPSGYYFRGLLQRLTRLPAEQHERVIEQYVNIHHAAFLATPGLKAMAGKKPPHHQGNEVSGPEGKMENDALVPSSHKNRDGSIFDEGKRGPFSRLQGANAIFMNYMISDADGDVDGEDLVAIAIRGEEKKGGRWPWMRQRYHRWGQRIEAATGSPWLGRIVEQIVAPSLFESGLIMCVGSLGPALLIDHPTSLSPPSLWEWLLHLQFSGTLGLSVTFFQLLWHLLHLFDHNGRLLPRPAWRAALLGDDHERGLISLGSLGCVLSASWLHPTGLSFLVAFFLSLTLPHAAVSLLYDRPAVEVIHPERLHSLDLKAMFWDFDGTLWLGYPRDVEAETWMQGVTGKKALSTKERAFGHAFFDRTKGLSLEERAAQWEADAQCQTYGTLPVDRQAFVTHVREVVKNTIGQRGLATPRYLVPGTAELLQALDERPVRLAIITGGSAVQRQAYAGSLGLEPFFTDIAGGGQKAQHIRRILSAWGLMPTHAAMIGDGKVDIQAAKEVGILAIGFAQTRADRAHLLEAGADVIINHDYRHRDAILQLLPSHPPSTNFLDVTRVGWWQAVWKMVAWVKSWWVRQWVQWVRISRQLGREHVPWLWSHRLAISLLNGAVVTLGMGWVAATLIFDNAFVAWMSALLYGLAGEGATRRGIEMLYTRYPLTPISPQTMIPHPERRKNLQTLHQLLSVDLRHVEAAYDAMVADIISWNPAHLLPQEMTVTFYILTQPQAAEYTTHETIGDPRGDDLLKSASTVQLKRSHLILKRPGLRMKRYRWSQASDLDALFRQLTHVTPKMSIAQMLSRLEIGGIGLYVPADRRIQLYRHAPHPCVVIGPLGDVLSWGIAAETLLKRAPDRTPSVIARYGKLLFGYHLHPSDSAPSSADRVVMRTRMQLFGRVVPEIIWLKEGDHRVVGHVYYSPDDMAPHALLPVTLPHNSSGEFGEEVGTEEHIEPSTDFQELTKQGGGVSPQPTLPDERETIERVGVAIRSVRHGGQNIFDPFTDYVHMGVFLDASWRVHLRNLPAAQYLKPHLTELRFQLVEETRTKTATLIQGGGDASRAGTLTLEAAQRNIQELQRLLEHLAVQRLHLLELHREVLNIYQGTDQQEVDQKFQRVFEALNQSIEKWRSRLELATATPSYASHPLDAILQEASGRRPMVTVDNHLPPSIYMIGNRLSLTSALRTLIDNAVHYAKKHEKETGVPAAVTIRVTQEDQHVHIDITDNGPGIPQALLEMNLVTGRPRLFDLNVSQREGGTGLGTTEAWYAIHDAGGSIEVQSKTNTGTTFTVRLPLTVSFVEPLIPAPTSSGSAAIDDRVRTQKVLDGGV